MKIPETRKIPIEQIIELYKANEWSSANKPEKLYQGLMNSHTLISAWDNNKLVIPCRDQSVRIHQSLINSHTLISAWDNNKLVGIGNAISDGHLVVYYPHLLVHPNYQGRGIGKMIVDKMKEKYEDFHIQMLTADGKVIDF